MTSSAKKRSAARPRTPDEQAQWNNFHDAANNPIQWKMWATACRAGAAGLTRLHDESWKRRIESMPANSSQSYPGGLPEDYLYSFTTPMLMGMSIECLFKALYLTLGNTLAEDGYSAKRHGHELAAWSRTTDFPYTPGETSVLVWLTRAIEHESRYPIPRSWRDWTHGRWNSVEWQLAESMWSRLAGAVDHGIAAWQTRPHPGSHAE